MRWIHGSAFERAKMTIQTLKAARAPHSRLMFASLCGHLFKDLMKICIKYEQLNKLGDEHDYECDYSVVITTHIVVAILNYAAIHTCVRCSLQRVKMCHFDCCVILA